MIKRLAMSFIGLIILAGCQEAVEKDTEDQKKSDANNFYQFYPAPRGEVSDFEGILKPTEVSSLAERIRAIEENAGIDLALVTADTLPPDLDGIVYYATELGNQWGIGNDSTKNGMVIVLSNKTQQVGIATGKGIENLYPDAVTQKIIDEKMLPYFSSGDFYQGLLSGINAVGELKINARDTLSKN